VSKEEEKVKVLKWVILQEQGDGKNRCRGEVCREIRRKNLNSKEALT
jgi:hypothetical protein